MTDIEADGQRVTTRDGESLLDALHRAGIAVPAACHHPDLPGSGNCRLCLVHIDADPQPRAACRVRPAEGMRVRTIGPDLDALRRTQLELLCSDLSIDAALLDTEFGHWLRAFDIAPKNAPAIQFAPDSDPHPSLRVDLNRCILCTRCIRACSDLQGRDVWGLQDRGQRMHLVAGTGTGLLEAGCESCGACAEYCPTGALSDRRHPPPGMASQRVTTTCPYCGVGCNFDLEIVGGRLHDVRANPAAAVNGRHLCVKGRYGLDFVHHEQRLTHPRVRRELLEGRPRPAGGRGEWVDTDWDTALDIVARRLAAVVREAGPDAIGILSSAKCSNEENYLMQKFARQVIGTHNIDHCARLCHSSTVAGLKAALGSGAMTNTMADIAEQAQALFVIGSNTTEQHPVFGAMLRQAARRRGVPLVVADPRRIDLVDFATLHLRQRPGTDVALVNGLMHLMYEHGHADAAFIAGRTEGFERLLPIIATATPARTQTLTGVPARDLRRAAELLGANAPMAVIWAMGITQHTCGVANVLALANLQLMLGNIGVAGGGVNPLRGQNNVQGACDTGCLPNVFPAYQAVDDAGARERFARAWALDGAPCRFSSAPGLTVTEMIEAAGRGAVQALFILGENAAMSDPALGRVHADLGRSAFTVVQEIFPSETADFADVLLPGASFAEKSGTFTNTERRIQRIRPALAPPGDARPDWAITADLARRVLAQLERSPSGPQAGWDYPDAGAIMAELASLAPSYAGVSHDRLDSGAQLHWPVPDAAHPGTPILHVGRCTHGRGIFHPVDHQSPAELPDARYPLTLTSGRVLYHWHGAAMTHRAAVLEALCPLPEIEIAAADAARAGISDGDTVQLHSRRGSMQARACINGRVEPGLVFGNFHFPGAANVNNLTNPALDPQAKIPEYKVCAVRLEKAAAAAPASLHSGTD